MPVEPDTEPQQAARTPAAGQSLFAQLLKLMRHSAIYGLGGLVSRFLAIFMLPLAGLVYVVAAMAGERYYRSSKYDYEPLEDWMFGTAGMVTWLFLAGYWILLWRSSVRWTAARRMATVGAAVLSFVTSLLVAVAINEMLERDIGSFVGSVMARMLWLVATVLIWRESADERIKRLRDIGTDNIVCPKCGYNLTGLHQARCPECGTQFTLNELLASQPGKALNEIER